VALHLALEDVRQNGGRVLYVGGETDERFMQERVRALKPGPAALHWFDRDGLDLSSAKGLDELLEEVRRVQPTHVILDTLSSTSPGIEVNEADRLGAAISGWRAARSVGGLGCCVWSIHHTTKVTWKPGGEAPSLSDLAGRGMLPAALDVGLILVPAPEAVDGAVDVLVFNVKQRNRMRARAMRLTIEIDTTHGNRWGWSEAPSKGDPKGSEGGPLPYEREILNLLCTEGQGASPGGSNQVANKLGCPKGRARQAVLDTIRKLKERGCIVQGAGYRLWLARPAADGPTGPGDHFGTTPEVAAPGTGPTGPHHPSGGTRDQGPSRSAAESGPGTTSAAGRHSEANGAHGFEPGVRA
jgi:hypothetical protein